MYIIVKMLNQLWVSIIFQIEAVFSNQLEYTCTIDEIDNKVESSGQAIADETDVKAHFIDEKVNEPVEKSVIASYVFITYLNKYSQN